MKLTGSKVTETRHGIWFAAALLGAIGCQGPSIDPQLQAMRRELSKQTVSTETDELPVREGDEEEMDIAMPMAGAGAPADLEEANEADDPEAPAPSNDDDPEAEPAPTPPPSEDETLSSDSVRCGDGVVDSDEHCDIGIEEGEPGSCPMECDNSDRCKPERYILAGCRTRCVPAEPPADCSE